VNNSVVSTMRVQQMLQLNWIKHILIADTHKVYSTGIWPWVFGTIWKV